MGYLMLKLKRKITGKPYGIAYFKIGRTEYPKVINFNKDVVHTKYGTWTIDKDKLYFEKEFNAIKSKNNSPIGEEEKAFFERLKFRQDNNKKEWNIDQFQDWREGFPVIHLDMLNASPAYFDTDRGTFKNATPQNIEATMGKEKTAFEWEVLKKRKDKIFLMLLILLIITIISVSMNVMMFNMVSKIGERVFQLPLASTGLPG